MPTAVTKEPFSLAGMGEMLRETNADLAAKVNVDEVEPPQPEPSPDPADNAPDDPEGDAAPPDAGAAKPDDTPESSAPTTTEEGLAAEQKRQQDEAAATAAQKKKDDEAATTAADADKTKADEAKKAADAAAQKTPEQEARGKRDEDLKDNLSPHTHPKTRKVIEAKNAKIQAARDERDRIIAEREAIKRERDELAAKAKGTALPKEVDEELKTLRERVRELDITKDPQIEAKYDRPMAANTKGVIELLKGFGADQIVDPKDQNKTIADPRFEANLLRSGLSLKTLQPFIEKLDKAGFADEAEAVREAVRENTRLAKAKAQEIDTWKGDYENRVKARTAQSQQQNDDEAKAFSAEAQKTLEADIAELTKAVPFLAPPPAPQATDSEPVRKAKQAALDEYNAAAKAVEQAIAAMNPAGQAPDKARAAAAKLNSTAVQGAVLKLHVLPRLQKDLASKDARIKELEVQLGRMRGATNLSRQHATLASAPANADAPIPSGAATPDAFSAFAKGLGVNINS